MVNALASAWAVDTTCTHWGYPLFKERTSGSLCCSHFPADVEKLAIDHMGVAGIASCRPGGMRPRIPSAAVVEVINPKNNNSIKVACFDTIAASLSKPVRLTSTTATTREKECKDKNAGAQRNVSYRYSGGRCTRILAIEHAVELSPKANKALFGYYRGGLRIGIRYRDTGRKLNQLIPRSILSGGSASQSFTLNELLQRPSMGRHYPIREQCLSGVCVKNAIAQSELNKAIGKGGLPGKGKVGASTFPLVARGATRRIKPHRRIWRNEVIDRIASQLAKSKSDAVQIKGYGQAAFSLLIQWYQSKKKIYPTGVLDTKTMKALNLSSIPWWVHTGSKWVEAVLEMVKDQIWLKAPTGPYYTTLFKRARTGLIPRFQLIRRYEILLGIKPASAWPQNARQWSKELRMASAKGLMGRTAKKIGVPELPWFFSYARGPV